jgi:arylacetamide deacetylase-like 3/4
MTPEAPYPESINDCYKVTLDVIQNEKELGIDIERLVIAGDSAGGNAVAVITQKLLYENKKMPKLQVLIYPWTQMINFRLPSFNMYKNVSFLNGMGVDFRKIVSWYIGFYENYPGYLELLESLENHQHLLLLEDKQLLDKYKSYLDPKKIPDQFKLGKSYYKSYESIEHLVYPKLDAKKMNIIFRDSSINKQARKLFNQDASPLFADKKHLIGLPKAYFIIFEWDELKDEGILYAERLKEAMVDVKIAYYEKAFHGMAALTHKIFGFELARKIRTELIDFIKLNV